MKNRLGLALAIMAGVPVIHASAGASGATEGMCWIPGGEVWMGSEEFYPEELPVRQVRVEGFWIDSRPVTVGEFGPIPYICNADKIKARWGGKKPWILGEAPNGFAPHMLWADGKYEERFYGWGLDKIYGDFTQFTEASDWYYFEGLKQQTDLMRMNGDIAGYIAWFADTTFHPVGLIDYFREKKIFCDELARIWSQNTVVVDIPTRRNFWAEESVRADVYVSHQWPPNFDRGILGHHAAMGVWQPAPR